MIDLYYYTSPNARKALMMLEEVGLPYRVQWVDITAGDQHEEAYARINPNGKIPALIDDDGPGGRPVVLFESGAILLYLAEKTGRLIPTDPARALERHQVVVLADLEPGPAARSGRALRQSCVPARHRCRVCGRALPQRGPPLVRCARSAACRPGLHLRPVLDRRHRRISVGARGQGPRRAHRRLPARRAMVRDDRGRPSARKKLDRDAATLAAAKTGYYNDATWKKLFGSTAGRSPTAASPRQEGLR